jgi:hypothetical protein
MGGGGGREHAERVHTERLEQIARDRLAGVGLRGPNVFLSFAGENLDLANALRGQAANDATDVRFQDWSVKEPYNSERADYIKARIRERIRRASIVVVLLTEESAHSDWVDWEAREGLRQGKKVIGMHPQATPPDSLPPSFTEHGLQVIAWSHEALLRALEQ